MDKLAKIIGEFPIYRGLEGDSLLKDRWTEAAIQRFVEYLVSKGVTVEDQDPHRLVPMPGTEGDWGRKHWGGDN